MADLSGDQLAFLQKFFDYDAKKYLQKRKLKALLQDFWRRRDKAQSEVADLPPDHPQKSTLDAAIKAATTKAEGGDLKGAYNDLNALKTQARTAATAVRGGVDTGAILSDLGVLETLIRRFRREQDRISDLADRGTQSIIDRITNLRDPGGGTTHEEVLETVSENFRDKQQALAEWDTLADNIKQDLETYCSLFTLTPNPKGMVDVISHNIALLNQKDPTAGKGAHNAKFATCHQNVLTFHLGGRGGELRTSVDTLMKQRRQALLDVMKAKTTAPGLEATTYTDEDGKALEGEDARQAAAAMAERFKVVEAREKERLERAKKAMREARVTDESMLKLTEDTSHITGARLRSFDTGDMMDGANIDVTDTKKTPDQIGQAAAQAVSEAMRDLMVGGGVPDEVFDMATRSPRDWYLEAAKAAGISFDPDAPGTIDPTVWAKIKAAGDAMQKAVHDAYPDKVKCDDKGKMTEATLGGVTYKEIKYLGGGGGGDVYKATDPISGGQIVLKVPKGFKAASVPSEKEHQMLRGEGGNHRAVSGGEDGPCPANVLDMKGVVLAPGGAPVIAMDLADAGDADDYTEAVGAAEHSGLISEPARQAMMAAQMRDIINGMKAMQAKGMTHHDLKEANVFLSSDGTFKVADFGLAEHVDGHEGVVRGLDEFTPGYEPPELFGSGNVTQKSDNFTLGEILEKITDPMRKRGEYSARFSSQNAGPGQKEGPDGKPVQTSALDRAINSLKDPDPSKRPTLDAVLMSSYFNDLDASHTPEDLTRLKKASVAYAKTVGKETADLNRALTFAEGEIRKLEQSKSDELTQAKIDHANRSIAENKAVIRELERQKSGEWDAKIKETLDLSITNRKESIESAQKRINGWVTELGVAKSSTELEEIQKRIDAKRKEIIELNKQIAAIHEKADHKDVIEELAEANKAFA